jgi:hypothetical protein
MNAQVPSHKCYFNLLLLTEIKGGKLQNSGMHWGRTLEIMSKKI